MTDEKKVEIWDKAYTSPKSVRETLLDIYEKGREDGRAEAIDEFAQMLINPSNYERFDFDDCLTDSNKANDFFKYVFAMAEQIKEKENEKENFNCVVNKCMCICGRLWYELYDSPY